MTMQIGMVVVDVDKVKYYYDPTRAVDDDTTRPGWQQGTLVRVALGPADARELDVMMAQRSDRR